MTPVHERRSGARARRRALEYPEMTRASRTGTLLALVFGALLICGVGWLINRQITVRLEANPAALERLAHELTHDEAIADLTQRVVTLEARKP